MYRSYAATALTLCMVLPACRREVTSTCTLEARAGINVNVRDSVTGAFTGGVVTVTAISGTQRENAVYPPSPNPATGLNDLPFGLAYERPGTYRVEVNHEMYKPWAVDGVQVTSGQCHVNAVTITAKLQH